MYNYVKMANHKIVIFIILFSIFSICSSSEIDLNNVLDLTDNFFMNLNIFVKDKGEPLNHDTKILINKQIDDYLKLVKITHGLSASSRNKRSIFSGGTDIFSMDFIGVYVLNGFVHQPRIPVQHPKDIVLFKHEFGSTEVWYAATLQRSMENVQGADDLIIYRYQDNNYLEVSKERITNGMELTTHTVHGVTYIAVAETYNSVEEIPTKGTAVYLFDIEEETLYKIQTFNVAYPTDIVLWEDMEDIFMAISYQRIDSQHLDVEIKTPIYKWTGEQFDVVQFIDAYCTKKIVPFRIGNVQFIAIANNKNNKGETDIYSEIFKYDIYEEQFIPYQKIFTHAAVDIKYFCFKQNNLKESFLVVANSFELDYGGGKNYRTNSIIYKFVDDYFMPFQSFLLNGAKEWLPVVGPNGEFVLLVSCNEGVKIFQYDGWRFIENCIDYTAGAFSNGITSMSSYIFNKQPIIVFANSNDRGNLQNVFSPIFTYQDVMNEYQKDMYVWCEEILTGIENNELEELGTLIENAPKTTHSIIQLKGKIIFHNATIENLITDDDSIPDKDTENLENLRKEISKRSSQLKRLETNDEPIVLNGDVIVKNLNIETREEIIFDNLYAEHINNENMDTFFNEIIYIDEPFIADNFEFEKVVFDGPVSVNSINNIPVEDLILKSSNMYLENDLIVEGNVVVEDLIVGGLVDGLQIDEENILLIQGEQYLEGSLSVVNMAFEELDVKYINYIDVKNLYEDYIFFNIYDKNIASLKIGNLSIGLVNKIDINTVERLALRKSGDQDIFGNYTFENLLVNEFEIDGLLTGLNISEALIQISNKTHFIAQDLIFTEPMSATNLHIISWLNQIPVFKGKLDVLLNNEMDTQYVSGFKTFDTLHLEGPINLHGRIHLEGLDRIKPFIENNLSLSGDYTVNGDIRVEHTFKFTDVSEPSTTYSLKRMEEQGLELTENEIPMSLDFQQELNVKNVVVDKINNIKIDSWIQMNQESKIITGKKIFQNDVDVIGGSCITSINDENLINLYGNILNIKGDQFITGKHHYNKVSSIRAVSDKTLVDNIPWDTVMTLDKSQYINGTTTINKIINISHFEAVSIDLRGKIQNFDFNSMVADTVFIDTNAEITGLKHFEEEVTFDTLNMTTINRVRMDEFLLDLGKWSTNVNVSGPLKIKKPIRIDKVLFNTFNGIPREKFGNNWLLKEGNQTIQGEMNFKSVQFQKDVSTKDNLINDLNIRDLNEKVVRIDREHTFDRMYFENGIDSRASIISSGKINKLDLNDVVLSKGLSNQTILGKYTILNNFTVNGYLYVNGQLSGLNLTIMDHFVFPSNQEHNLVVQGNLILKGETNVNVVNNYSINALSQNTWFKNRQTNYKGFIKFKKAIFEDEINVLGHVDDVNIGWLSKNYLSKSKNQTISAKLEFTDGIVCEQEVIAENAQVSGLLGGIMFSDFESEILQNKNQQFDFDMKFEDVQISEHFDSSTINELNLKTDVVRYDVFKNVITANKVIKQLNVDHLEMPKGRNIQNVNIENWFNNTVLLNQSSYVTGQKTFIKATFLENIDLEGPLNGYLFTEEHILTKNSKQNIIGKKTFSQPVSMQNLKLKGQLNDIEIDDFMKNQIDVTKDVVIDTHIAFKNKLNASNLIFEQLYQGIQMPNLVENLENLNKVNSYYDQYQGLLNVSKRMLNSLQFQAYFLIAYKEIQIIPKKTLSAVPLENNIIAMVDYASFKATISLYTWKSKTEEFAIKNEIFITTTTEIVYIQPVIFKKKWHLYIEEKNNPSNEYTHTGTLYEMTNKGRNTYNILTNGTNSIASIIIPNKQKSCVTTVHTTQNYVNINCEGHETLELFQQLKIPNARKVVSSLINNKSYLFVISKSKSLLESYVDIWKYDERKNIFKQQQKLQLINPNNFDVINYRKEVYLVVASNHVPNVINLTPVVIFKLNGDKFQEMKQLKVTAPVEIKLNILTTNELVLYIITDCPSEPLLIYKYEGISGFKRKINALTLPKVTSIAHFTTSNTNFIVVANKDETRVIKAVYTGQA